MVWDKMELARAMTAGFRLRQRIQTTRGDIFLNLAVPPSSVKLGEPRPKCCESGRGKPANGILDLSNRAHVGKLTPLDRPAQPHALKEKLKPKSKRTRLPGSGLAMRERRPYRNISLVE